jgi:membrane associated rhomboid family serine protease
MARIGSSTLVFPPFRGFTKRLVLANLIVFFTLLVLGAVNGPAREFVFALLALSPRLVVHGYIWQLVTYSFLHRGILEVLFNLLSLWFIGSYLEEAKGSRWLMEIYFAAVGGGALIATALSFASIPRLSPLDYAAGAQAGIFGLLAAFAVLFGEQQFFLFPLPIGIKAKYLVLIYLLIAIASLFGGGSILSLVVYLGGGLLGFLYARQSRTRGFSFAATEKLYGFRNEYYRWKRRRAARKFEVYMRKHNRDVKFDHEGRYIDPDASKNPNDRKWMN